MSVQVGKWGNSLAVRLPKNITDKLGVKVNDNVNFTIEKGKIVLKISDDKPKFTLDELLSEYPSDRETEIDWGCSVGLEEI